MQKWRKSQQEVVRSWYLQRAQDDPAIIGEAPWGFVIKMCHHSDGGEVREMRRLYCEQVKSLSTELPRAETCGDTEQLLRSGGSACDTEFHGSGLNVEYLVLEWGGVLQW